MFWGDAIVDLFLKGKDQISSKKGTLIIRDEKTMSGRPHVGSLRSFIMHATLSDILTEKGIENVFFYEINDTDAFDKVPVYVPKSWKEHLGKRLKDVPSPEKGFLNFPEYFANSYSNVLLDAQYRMTFYRNSEKYLSGAFDSYIRLALEKRDLIRTIYREVSGSEKPDTWFPCQVICDQCGKIATTQIVSFDGKEVSYTCNEPCRYTEGCGYSGRKSPFKGNATLPWKVEWAAKFCVMNVDIEGAGKDHYAAGGSRHVANRICQEVFQHKHPFDVRHEFILVSGAKMSSSSGIGATAEEVYHFLPRHIFRFMMIQKDIMKTINFSPEGDTIPVIFDQYDETCLDYFSKNHDEMHEHKKRIFELAHFYERDRISDLNRFLPRFSHLAFYLQMPHVDIEEKFSSVKGSPLTAQDKEELSLRVECAKHWLSTSSPEKYIFKIQEIVPASVSALSALQKDFLRDFAEYLRTHRKAIGQDIQAFIFDTKERLKIDPPTLFEAIYVSLLGKTSGPKAGWLLEALDREFLIQRFSEAASYK